MDLVVVPTIGFSLPDAFVIVRLNRRPRLDLCHYKPDIGLDCASMTEAFPWDDAPKYLIMKSLNVS